MELKVKKEYYLKDLVEIFGSEKQKNTYNKNKKLSTNQTNSLLKDVSKYGKLEVINSKPKKYMFIEIYDNILEKEDKRTLGNNKNKGKFLPVVRDRILADLYYKYYEFLEKTDNKELNMSDCKVTYTKNELRKAASLIGRDYSFYKYNIPKLSEEIDVIESDLRAFFEAVDTKCSVVSRALKQLKDESVILTRDTYKVIERKLIVETEVDKYGNVSTQEYFAFIDEKNKKDLIYRQASIDEERIILKAEHEAKKKLNLKNDKAVILAPKEIKDNYYALINQLIEVNTKKHINCKYNDSIKEIGDFTIKTQAFTFIERAFKATEITLVKEILEEEFIELNKENLQETIYDSILSDLVKYKDSELNKIAFGENIEKLLLQILETELKLERLKSEYDRNKLNNISRLEKKIAYLRQNSELNFYNFANKVLLK